MRFTKKQVIDLAKEVSRIAHDRVHTVVFQDGSISQVTGPFQANKPVWVDFEGSFSPQEALDALWEACEDENGNPYTPK
jgi:hypothetical protein